jgi:hypothetical protein
VDAVLRAILVGAGWAVCAAAQGTNNVPDYAPKPDDARLARGRVFLERSAVAGGKLTIEGNLPTPCHQLRVTIAGPNAGGAVTVEVYSLSDRGAICAQVLKPFSADLNLTPAQAAAQILVNGERPGAPAK